MCHLFHLLQFYWSFIGQNYSLQMEKVPINLNYEEKGAVAYKWSNM